MLHGDTHLVLHSNWIKLDYKFKIIMIIRMQNDYIILYYIILYYIILLFYYILYQYYIIITQSILL